MYLSREKTDYYKIVNFKSVKRNIRKVNVKYETSSAHLMGIAIAKVLPSLAGGGLQVPYNLAHNITNIDLPIYKFYGSS
ncbi:MAG: hypothetical protein V3V33_13610 [Candidatus Lokiarchaeia archaeon]